MVQPRAVHELTAPSCVAAVIGIAPGAPANILPALPKDPDAVAKLRDESLGCPVMMPEDRPVEPRNGLLHSRPGTEFVKIVLVQGHHCADKNQAQSVGTALPN